MTGSRRHLLTGAGSGIGAALARLLSDRGDELWLLARSSERAAELAAACPGASPLVADLGDPAGLESALGSSLPDRLDSLVHVAGAVDLGPVADQPLDLVHRQIEVNLVAPMVLTRLLLPALRARRGLVVVVNSTAGLTANADWSAYAASKAGARAFADSLRAEEAGHGVRVTSVFPSRTATPMQAKVHEQEGKEYDPSRFLRPDTVAASILHVLDLPPDATIPELVLRAAP